MIKKITAKMHKFESILNLIKYEQKARATRKITFQGLKQQSSVLQLYA